MICYYAHNAMLHFSHKNPENISIYVQKMCTFRKLICAFAWLLGCDSFIFLISRKAFAYIFVWHLTTLFKWMHCRPRRNIFVEKCSSYATFAKMMETFRYLCILSVNCVQTDRTVDGIITRCIVWILLKKQQWIFQS